jgi:hypothetical protein
MLIKSTFFFGKKTSPSSVYVKSEQTFDGKLIVKKLKNSEIKFETTFWAGCVQSNPSVQV